jgi:DNA-directed RNA polymerase alpha subunit
MNEIKKTNPMFNIAMKAKHDTLSELFGFIKKEIEIIEKKIGYDDIFISSIDNLELSKRSMTALKLLNINYIGDLVTKSEGELLTVPNFGRLSLNEVKNVLSSLGLGLYMKHIIWPRKSVPVIPRKFDNFFMEIKKQEEI